MRQKTLGKIIAVGILLPCTLFGLYLALSAVKVMVQQTNQANAVKTLKQIEQAERAYKAKNKKYGNLSELAKASLINLDVSKESNMGYKFAIVAKDNSYTLTATPTRSGVWATAHISYYMDESGVIRGGRKSGKEATASDPQLSSP